MNNCLVEIGPFLSSMEMGISIYPIRYRHLLFRPRQQLQVPKINLGRTLVSAEITTGSSLRRTWRAYFKSLHFQIRYSLCLRDSKICSTGSQFTSVNKSEHSHLEWSFVSFLINRRDRGHGDHDCVAGQPYMSFMASVKSAFSKVSLPTHRES